MRFAITFEPDVEAGNAFEKDPKKLELLMRLMEEAKPEVFYTSSSRRFGIIIVKTESQEELVKLLVPIWHIFKVYPRVDTVMNVEEFKAAQSILREQLVKGL